MHDDHIDEHAETWVLPPSKSPLWVEPLETDPLELYDEYVRTVAAAGLAPPAGAPARTRD